MSEAETGSMEFSWYKYLSHRVGLFFHYVWATILGFDFLGWYVCTHIASITLKIVGEILRRPVWSLMRVLLIMATLSFFFPSLDDSLWGHGGGPRRYMKTSVVRKVQRKQHIQEVPVADSQT